MWPDGSAYTLFSCFVSWIFDFLEVALNSNVDANTRPRLNLYSKNIRNMMDAHLAGRNVTDFFIICFQYTKVHILERGVDNNPWLRLGWHCTIAPPTFILFLSLQPSTVLFLYSFIFNFNNFWFLVFRCCVWNLHIRFVTVINVNYSVDKWLKNKRASIWELKEMMPYLLLERDLLGPTNLKNLFILFIIVKRLFVCIV